MPSEMSSGSPPRRLLSTARGPSRMVYRHSFPAVATLKTPGGETRLRGHLEGLTAWCARHPCPRYTELREEDEGERRGEGGGVVNEPRVVRKRQGAVGGALTLLIRTVVRRIQAIKHALFRDSCGTQH